MPKIDLLKEHELWANKIIIRLISVFIACSIPVFFVLRNVPLLWRVTLPAFSVVLLGVLVLLFKNDGTAHLTKYTVTLIMNFFGFLMTVTMGEGNRSVPFYFFSILAFSLIYLNPKVILFAAMGTLLSHGIMMTFFPKQIFALHQPGMYIFAGFIYLIYFLAVYTIAVKATELLDKLKQREDVQTKLNQELNEIQRQIAVSSSRLRNTSNALSKQATELMSAAEQTAGAMEEMTRMIDVETKEVTQVSQSVVEINSLAQRIKERTDVLAEAFDNTEDIARRGADHVYSTMNGMKNVGTQIGHVAEAARRLRESSLRIKDILTIMNEIAEKTTLLSLNASIEAARAGSAGRGFAVVAEEIGKLSVQSAQSTEEIKKIVSDTLLEVEEVSTSIELSLSIVKKGTNETGAVSDEIKNIMENIRLNSQQIKDLYQALERLVARNNSIMDGANSLAGIAEETSAATQEISASVQSQSSNVTTITGQIRVLGQMASSLDDLVRKVSG